MNMPNLLLILSMLKLPPAEVSSKLHEIVSSLDERAALTYESLSLAIMPFLHLASNQDVL